METRQIFGIEPECRPRSPMLLFVKEDFQEEQPSHGSSSALAQLSLLSKRDGSSFNIEPISTTPKFKKAATIPTAPVKERKGCIKIDLKPKKLMFSEEDSESTVDTGSIAKPSSNISWNPTFHKVISNSPTVRLSRIELPQGKNTKLLSCNKENQNSNYDRAIHTQISKKTLSQSSSFGCLPETNSMSGNNDSYWYDVLTELQPQREVGVWVQCCNKHCKKWRYIRECCDPTEVPDMWYCSMNADKSVASCEIPEMSISPEIKSDLIENLYNAGSLVWARIKGYPWWPGIVDDCPDTFTYYKLRPNSIKPFMYHVTFIDRELLERAWIYTRYIKPFIKTKYSDMVKKTKYYGIEYKDRLNDAYNIALTAVPLTILQKLQKFSFVAPHQQLNGIRNFASMSPQLSVESVIPATPDTRKSLKDLYTQYIENSSQVIPMQCDIIFD